jgi:hypothetical protein
VILFFGAHSQIHHKVENKNNSEITESGAWNIIGGSPSPQSIAADIHKVFQVEDELEGLIAAFITVLIDQSVDFRLQDGFLICEPDVVSRP